MSFSEETLGYWVEDTPYKISKNGRIYGKLPQVLLNKVAKCKEVEKYFKVANMMLPTTGALLVEGRLWWGQITAPTIPRIVVGREYPLTPLAKSLIKGIKGLDVSTLICGLNIDLEPLLKSSGDQCTLYGRKIATSLIKVASTRIFANPEQSFMEPIANSIDSYYPERRIGKFGMGFFSLLYWLVKDPESTLTIKSYVLGETFEIVLRYKNHTIVMDLDILEHSRVQKTGTTLVLEHNFEDVNQASFNFSRYIEKFKEVQGINLFLRSQSNYSEITANGKNQKLIGVRFDIQNPRKSKITFDDQATGIPLNVVFESLLIPSISTKKIVGGSSRIPSKPSRVNKTSRNTEFLITVADVIIFAEEIKKPYFLQYIEKAGMSSPEDIQAILSLPSDTQMPVGRDDFIGSPIVRKIIFESFEKTLGPAFKNLSILEDLVDKYISYTNSYENKLLMEEALSAYRDKLKILVPGKWMEIYEIIDPSVVGSNHYSILKLETWLDSKYTNPGNIWKGIKVIFVPLGKYNSVTFAGTNSFLFVPESMRLEKDWKNRLEASFTERKLIPFTEHNDSIIREHLERDNIPLNISDQNLALYLALLNTIKAKDVWYDYENSWEEKLGKFVGRILRNHPQFYYSVLSALVERISKSEPVYSYGSEKRRLEVFHMGIEFDDTFLASKIEKALTEKYYSFLFGYFLWKSRNDFKEYLYSICPTKFFITYILPNETLKESETFFEFIIAQKILFRVSQERAFVNIPSFILKPLVRDIKIHINSILSNAGEFVNYLNQNSVLNSDIAIIEIIYYKTLSRLKNILIPKSVLQEPVTAHNETFLGKFTTSALIDTIFRSPYTGLEFYRTIKHSNPPLKLQILSLAVNEATTKSFEEASVIETFQNSVDAIRMSGEKREIKIKVMRDPNVETRVIYEIFDAVGMNEEQFFHIGVPFLSSKTPSELQTGEMGTGFFNVYRMSTKVTIKTFDGKGYKLVSVDVPLRKEGRVGDIERKIYMESDPNFPKGTSIELIIDFKTKEEALDSIGKFNYVIESILPGCPLDINIFLNDIPLPPFDGTKIFETEFYEIYFSKKKNVPMIYTKGIPLDLLDKYVKGVTLNYLFGISVNLKNKGYTPVHSRTKVNLDPKIENFVQQVKLLAGFNYQRRSNLFLQHTNSPGPVIHLKLPIEVYFNWDDAGFWLFASYPFQENICVARIVNELVDVYGDQIPGENIHDEIKKGSKKSSDVLNKIKNPHLKKEIADIVANWFRPKNSIGGTSSKNIKKPSTKSLKKSLEVPVLVKKFIEAYCKVYSSMLSKHFSVRKNLKVYCDVLGDNSVLGLYYSTENKIEIMIKRELFEDAKSSVEKFMSLRNPNEGIDGKFWREYLTDSDAVIPHELEHYRRSTTHNQNASHAEVSEVLFGVADRRSFPNSHLFIRSQLILKGLWENVKKELS